MTWCIKVYNGWQKYTAHDEALMYTASEEANFAALNRLESGGPILILLVDKSITVSKTTYTFIRL